MFTPEESDGSVVIVPAEFMDGRHHTGGIVRALGIQALNPHAIVAYMPNDCLRFGHSHTNLTMKEKWNLAKNGDTTPYADRYNTLLEQLPRDSYDAIDAPVTLFGPSQGAEVASAYAAHPESRATGLTVVEAPNLIDGRLLELAKAFPNSGPLLKEVIARNYGEVDSSVTLEADLNKELEIAGIGRYFIGGLRLGRLALIAAISSATLEPRLKAALDKNVAVVHAWASGDMISPRNANALVAANLEGNDRYEAYELEGDHSIANDSLYMAALARRAFLLPSLNTA